jgi:hypothetical protein
MKKIKLVIYILLVFVTISSCKKLIEIPQNPPSQIQEDAIFADSSTVMGAMAGVYSYYYNEFGFSDGNLSKLTGLSADELKTTLTYDATLPQFYTNQLTSDNQYSGTFWTTIYNALYKVNVDIEGITGSKGLSATLKQQLLGELKVLRALYYFHLVNLFGGVPLVTSSDYNVTATLPRATADEVYTQILSDLSDARKMLVPAYPSEGHARPNLYTAEALSAKVYLYRGDWQDAFQMADDIIKSGTYQLEMNLNNVFLNGSVEAIWQIPAQTMYNQTTDAGNFVPQFNTFLPGYLISDSLKSAFEPGDQRWTNWVGLNMVDVNGTTGEYYYPAKYKNLAPPYTTTEDFMIFRLADQYLIRAEANAQLSNLNDAVDDLFKVRDRAGLLRNTASSKEDILKAVARERQVELFCEWGNRWFDLKRTKTIDAVLGAEKTTWQPDAALYPIPFQEIKKNTTLKQNPGYN